MIKIWYYLLGTKNISGRVKENTNNFIRTYLFNIIITVKCPLLITLYLT